MSTLIPEEELGDGTEYDALRQEIIAKHNAALAVFTASIGLITAVIAIAKPDSSQNDALHPECALACGGLQVFLICSALLIRSMFIGTRRIGTYLQVFHEGPQTRRWWETAGSHYHGGRPYFNQPTAMSISYAVFGLLIAAYGVSCAWQAHNLYSWQGIFLLLFSVLELAAAWSLPKNHQRPSRAEFVAEWQKVRNKVLGPFE